MARVKRGIVTHRKHKKLHELTKGYRGGRGKLVREAKSASLHAGEYAFAGRKNRKRDFRRLWITRINEAVRSQGLSYSVFVNKLKAANIELDRKILSQLIVENPETFANLIDEVKSVN